MQQHSVLSARARTQEVPTCGLDKLPSEGEPVQSANFCFLCNLLHMQSSAVDLLLQTRFAPSWIRKRRKPGHLDLALGSLS